jgi:hypothetical protein
MRKVRSQRALAAVLCLMALGVVLYLSTVGADVMAKKDGDSGGAGITMLLLAGAVAFVVATISAARRRRSY